jgi:hypothetical protein
MSCPVDWHDACPAIPDWKIVWVMNRNGLIQCKSGITRFHILKPKSGMGWFTWHNLSYSVCANLIFWYQALFVYATCLKTVSCHFTYVQAINGGNATWFGIPIPFDLNTLLAIVSCSC